MAAIFILLGTKIYAPLFKSTPETFAFEGKLDVNTLLAAPETASLVVDFPEESSITHFDINDGKVCVFSIPSFPKPPSYDCFSYVRPSSGVKIPNVSLENGDKLVKTNDELRGEK